MHRTVKTLAVILTLAAGMSAAAETRFKVLHNFRDRSDGANPVLFAALAMDEGGNLFGAAAAGGDVGNCEGWGCGVIFEMVRGAGGRWTEKALYETADPWTDGIPNSQLALDSHGNLYGCTRGYGNNAPMFELTRGSPQWKFNPIWPSGCQGAVGLILDGAGNLYGNMGTEIGELSPSSHGWVYTNLYEFYQADGVDPLAPFSWDAKGNLYGTTYSGGGYDCNCGVAFQMTPNADGTWNYNVMHRFSYGKDGGDPLGSLTVDSAGNAYGTTTHAGPYGNGNVFKLTPGNEGQWKLTVLYGFPDPNHGFAPGGNLVFDKAGNLYGIAGSPKCNGGCGLVFKLSPQKDGKWSYSVLHQFNWTDGNFPNGLTMDKQGNLYGTTSGGGKYGYGVVFELTP